MKFIRISTGYSKKCIELQVREFVPQEGDKLERTWVYQGTKKSVMVPPYALMDLEDGKTAYMKHISDAMGDTLQHIAERSSGLLKKTYIQAFRMYRDTTIPEDWKQLFDWTFRLWTAVRLSTTSDFIVGEEKLGMSDNILDTTNPNHGKIPVPPVLGAQLDLVMIHHIQTRLRRELLDKLQKMVLKNKQSTWFVTYLVTFMLLHNAALITAHDAAYARKHGIRVSHEKEIRDDNHTRERGRDGKIRREREKIRKGLFFSYFVLLFFQTKGRNMTQTSRRRNVNGRRESMTS